MAEQAPTQTIDNAEELMQVVMNSTAEYFQHVPGLQAMVAVVDPRAADFRVAAVGGTGVFISFEDLAIPGGPFTSPSHFMNVIFTLAETYQQNPNRDVETAAPLVCAATLRDSEGSFPLYVVGVQPPEDTDPLVNDVAFGDLAITLLGNMQSDLNGDSQ